MPAGVFKPDEHGNAIMMDHKMPEGVEAKAFAITRGKGRRLRQAHLADPADGRGRVGQGWGQFVWCSRLLLPANRFQAALQSRMP